jgi:hypothetical protein
MPAETRLEFAMQEIRILNLQMEAVIDLYRNLPGCRQEASCGGEVPGRWRVSNAADPRDREIADLRGELARARAEVNRLAGMMGRDAQAPQGVADRNGLAAAAPDGGPDGGAGA